MTGIETVQYLDFPSSSVPRGAAGTTMASDVVVPSDILHHVYSYLIHNNLNKAANSLKKECGVVSAVVGKYLNDYYNIITDTTTSERTWSIGLL